MMGGYVDQSLGNIVHGDLGRSQPYISDRKGFPADTPYLMVFVDE